MDMRYFEVEPNHNSTSRFKFKIVEVWQYDSGHKSKHDHDWFEDIHLATQVCEQLNVEEQQKGR